MPQNRSPIDQSVYDTITLLPNNPGPGNDLNFSVPTNRRILPIAIRFLFTTDANVASRNVVLAFHDGTQVYCEIPPESSIPASIARAYSYNLGGNGPYTDANQGERVNLLPQMNWMDDNAAIQTIVNNLQSGDTITNIFIRCAAQIIE